MRVPFDDLYAALHRAMLHLGLTGDRASLCARLFAETTRDGVYTHGLNRFPRFVQMVRNGSIDLTAEPSLTTAVGSIERWNGNRGPGNLNAYASIHRSISLAREHGIGGVALANTNHWMRGGTYGWIAAEAGLFSLCWTNTLANLPAWGASTPTVGNNPLVIAVPRASGPVVLDMAMTQFSYGTIAAYSKRGTPLPVDGGFDLEGNLTRDAAAIEASQRALPVGYWKGSGLSLVLDMLAAMLSGGKATHEFPMHYASESGISQIFLCIDPANLASAADLNRIADGIIDSLRRATPIDPARPVRYPGEETARVRQENLRLGVPVDPDIFQHLTHLTF